MIILFTIILFENWNRANIDKHVDDFQLQADENGGIQLMGEEESSGEVIITPETKTATPSRSPTATPSASPSASPSQSPTPSESPTESPEPTLSRSPTQSANFSVFPPKTTIPPTETPTPSDSYWPGMPTPSFLPTPFPSVSPNQTDTPTPSLSPLPTAPPPPTVQPPTAPENLTVPPTPLPPPPPEPGCPFNSLYFVNQCLYTVDINDNCFYGVLEKDITDKHQFDLVSAKIITNQSTTQNFNFDYFYYNLTIVGKTDGYPTEIQQSHVGESNIQNHLELQNVNFFLNSEATINTLFLFKKSLINSHDSYSSNFTHLTDASLVVFDETTLFQSFFMQGRPISKGFSFDEPDYYIKMVDVHFGSMTFRSNKPTEAGGDYENYTIYFWGVEKEIYLRTYPHPAPTPPPPDSDEEPNITFVLHDDYLKYASNPLTIKILLLGIPLPKIKVSIDFRAEPIGDFSVNLIVQNFTKFDTKEGPKWYLEPGSTFYELEDGRPAFTSSYGPFHELSCPTVVPTPQPMDDDAKATGFIIALPFILIVVLACLIVLICYCKRYSNSAKEDSSDDDSYDMDSSTVES